jgi:methyl-accepting chemotaxis protein
MTLLNSLKIKQKLYLIGGIMVAGTFGIILVASLSLRETMENEKKLKTRHVVEVAYSVLEHYYSLAKAGVISEQDAKKAAVSAVRSLRYEDSDYFWINDMHPTMLMHPYMPELDGKDLSDYQDPQGKRLFIEFVEIVKARNAGFVSYLWPKPGVAEPVRKVSYVKGFAPWGWIVGSGIYLDDVDAHFRKSIIDDFIILTAIIAVFGILLLQVVRSIVSAEKEQRGLVIKLQEALSNIKTLRGLLPVCAWCKKIRNDKGYWEDLETYIHEHSDADFTHGICPQCMKEVVDKEEAAEDASHEKVKPKRDN